MQKIFIIFVIINFTITSLFTSDIKVCQSEKSKYQFRIELANLILRKTSFEYGHAKVIPIFKKDPTQNRCIKLLKKNKVDLLYLPATNKRLKELNVIKIDIHNGMLGYRVFIINKKDEKKFSKIKSLKDLEKFTAGFGQHWGDYKIFSLNNLSVVGAANTDLLLKMLHKKRFDYFHRGLHEAWAEVEEHNNELPNLMVEKHIALLYDFPVYFMFNKKNKILKERFKKGFSIILKDSSFKNLYEKSFNKYVKKANLQNRTILRIKYPTPNNIPDIDTSLWLKK